MPIINIMLNRDNCLITNPSSCSVEKDFYYFLSNSQLINHSQIPHIRPDIVMAINVNDPITNIVVIRLKSGGLLTNLDKA